MYKSQKDGWGEDIDLGIFDTGMTTICSPRYDFKDDEEHQSKHEKEENHISNDLEEHVSDKDVDTSDTEYQGEEKVTYNKSCVGQLEAELEETQSNLKLVIQYLRKNDQRFCSHHKDILVSHKSIASFMEKSYLDEEIPDKEITSKKSDEQNVLIEDDNERVHTCCQQT